MKAIELQQYDSQKSHRYNHVAGEFQLFQVLMQRFIENEPFQGGPRIQNYVKNRCVIRNLLHVPAIKGDILSNFCFNIYIVINLVFNMIIFIRVIMDENFHKNHQTRN